eukprot:TRINITY_DN1207_c0_g1_i1.p1 TRINITY_DN1207_c0_g1~~TRINITY_DN1207_c0_g1_i1.p1  ORF type:complete len:669 (-),score=155.81 TRINITY_DN1207_c0_g1_i1:338-2275(-)
MDVVTQVGSYTIGRVLGEGCNAHVREATHLETKQKVAIKFLKKTSIPESFRTECEIFSQTNHPNIIQLYEVIEESNFLAAAMEYCSGGDLLIYIQQMERLDHKETKRIFLQILSAVRYLHDLRIIHRDLKAENILLDKNKNPKLGDFGFAGFYNPDGQLNKSCGSLHYAAPELCEGKSYKGPEVDIWSLGVLLYGMITGTLPFDGYDAKEIISKICSGQFYLTKKLITASPNNPKLTRVRSFYKNTDQLDEDSNKLIDLIRSILKVSPIERATLEEIETHPWITGKSSRDPIDELFNSNNRIFASLLTDDEKNSLSTSQKFRKLLLSSTSSLRDKDKPNSKGGSVREKEASRRGTVVSSSPRPSSESPEDGPVVLRRRRTKTSLGNEGDNDPDLGSSQKNIPNRNGSDIIPSQQPTSSGNKSSNQVDTESFEQPADSQPYENAHENADKQIIRSLVTKMFRSKKITAIQRRASFSDSPLEGGSPASLYKPGHFGDLFHDLERSAAQSPHSPHSPLPPHSPPQAISPVPLRSPYSPNSPHSASSKDHSASPALPESSTFISTTSSSPPPTPSPLSTSVSTTTSSTKITPPPPSGSEGSSSGEATSPRKNRGSIISQTFRENKTTMRLLKTGKRTGSIIFRKKQEKS